MDITAIQKNIHTTPRKLRLVVDLVKKMTPAQALLTLQFTNKVAAEPLTKAIKTVMANAKQQNIDQEKLIFKKLEINEGTKMKRFRAGTKGRAKKYAKRTSHIRIVLEEKGENGTKD